MGKKWRVSARPPKGRDGRNCQLRLTSPDGRRTQESAGTADLGEAKAIARARERELNGEQIPFSVVVKRYVECRRADRGTRKRTHEWIAAALPHLVRELRDQEVTKRSLARARTRLAQRLSPTYVNQILRAGGKAWRWAQDEGLVEDDWPRVNYVPVKQTDMRHVRPAEAELILREFMSHQGGRYYALIALLYDTGARVSEVLALKELDLNREESTVHLRVTKTGVDRVVHVNPDILALVPVRDPGSWAFPAVRDKSKPLNRGTVGSNFRRVLAKVGLEGERLSLHSFRRSWIVDAMSDDVPLGASMRHVGHASPKVHVAYQRLAVGRRMREAAETVRSSRNPLPHQDPPLVGGLVIQRHAAQGGVPTTLSDRYGAPERRPSDSKELRPKTPHHVDPFEVIVRLMGEGEDVANALVRLTRDHELQSFVRELSAQQN